MKKISVIVPVYNRKGLVEQTIGSVLDQTYPHWELLLVDDGSTDGSDKICKSFASRDERIKFIERTGQTKGAPVCRNLGVKNATGDFVLFLDSDDLLASYCLQQRLTYIDKYPGLDFYIFPMVLFKERVDDMMVLQNIPTGQDPLDRFIHRENVWLMSCPLWTIESVKKTGGFNENYLSYQDWEMNVRALAEGLQYRFFSDAKPDNFYRQHNATISAVRFTQPYNISNAEMIITITTLLKNKELLTENRRCALAGFLVDVLKRAKLLPMPVKEIRQFVKTYTQKALEENLLVAAESKFINQYIYWHTVKLAFRSGAFKNYVEKYFRTKKLAHLFPEHTTNQLKHKYTGELA